jgi:hypothetical protein
MQRLDITWRYLKLSIFYHWHSFWDVDLRNKVKDDSISFQLSCFE